MATVTQPSAAPGSPQWLNLAAFVCAATIGMQLVRVRSSARASSASVRGRRDAHTGATPPPGAPAPNTPHPSLASGDAPEVVPRCAGVSARGEAPWCATEGAREFTLGAYKEVTGAGADTDAQAPNERVSAPEVRLAEGAAPYVAFVDDTSVIVADIVRNSKQRNTSRAYVRAGARAQLYFAPSSVRAAIVTCGGLCPGLNNVIRELVNTMQTSYGVSTIYGVQHGYWGFHTPDADPGSTNPNCPKKEPPLLTVESVSGIHHYGGTVLGSDRGGDAPDVALRFMANRGINQLYVIGGDGSHRGAHAIFKRAQELNVRVSIAAIPKTIDNDVDIIDKSFGFDTAVAEAQHAINTAKIEAAGAVNGIGIVKLMGRYAGFIAGYATLASGDVDLCLIPEVPVITEGPHSILKHLEQVVARKGHAVVVVAEGAGEDLLDAEIVKAGGKVQVDAGGNRKLPPIGPWLTDRVKAHFESIGHKATIKYIDPSYMVRSVAANPADAIYCCLLAQNAVHGAMAGYTGFSVGLVNNRLVYLPIPAITANSPRRMNPRGRTYERILAITRQPDPLSDPELAAEWAKKTGGAKGGE